MGDVFVANSRLVTRFRIGFWAPMGTSSDELGTFGHLTEDNGGYSWSLMVTRKSLKILDFQGNSLERATRIELAFSAWEADVLPLNYARVASIVVGFGEPIVRPPPPDCEVG